MPLTLVGTQHLVGSGSLGSLGLLCRGAVDLSLRSQVRDCDSTAYREKKGGHIEGGLFFTINSPSPNAMLITNASPCTLRRTNKG